MQVVPEIHSNSLQILLQVWSLSQQELFYKNYSKLFDWILNDFVMKLKFTWRIA